MGRRMAIGTLCFLWWAAATVSAINGKTVIPLSSGLYGYIDALYMEAGETTPSSARPWTADEMRSVTIRLDDSRFSDTGKGVRAYILEQLDRDDAVVSEEHFTFDSEPSLTVEGFYHHSINDTTASAPQAYEWIHGYEERRPFLKIPLEFWYGDNLYLTSELAAKEEIHTVTSPDTPGVASNYLNVLVDDPNIRLDLYFPFRAVMSVGGPWWNLLFGRDQLSWGNGASGNLMLSDYSDFYDLLQLSLISPSFRFTSVFISGDRFLTNGTDVGTSGFIGHRLEMRFFDRVGLTISEAVTYANLPLELMRDLNYLMVFHNWMSPGRFNSVMTVELNVNPWRYFTVYGHLAMDEFAVKYEIDRGGGGGPPVFGYLAGIQGAYPLGRGYLDAAFEWVRTSPWLYNRRSPPYFHNVRRYWSLVTDKMEYVGKPYGYEYGSDVIVYHGSASYGVPGLFSAAMEVERIAKGEKGMSAVWDPAPGDLSPTGIPEVKWVIHVDGSWQPFSFLEIGGAVNWQTTENPGHAEGESKSDLEITAFVTLKL